MPACSGHLPLRAFYQTLWATDNKDQFRLGSKCGQDGYLGPVACDPSFYQALWESPPSDLLHFLRIRLRGPRDRKISETQQTDGSQPPLISGRRSPICSPFSKAPKICWWTRERHPEELLLVPFERD